MNRRNSIVDLTSGSLRRSSAVSLVESSPSNSQALWTAYPTSPPTIPRGTKRRRMDHGSPAASPANAREGTIESIDLTELDSSSALAKSLAKQREDAIRSQQSGDQEKVDSVLKAYKCPICMDTPENATSTACGHLFCHNCIIECLTRASEQNNDSNKQVKGTCPVCRKSLTRNETSGPRRSLIPIMLKLTTKKRSAVPPTQA